MSDILITSMQQRHIGALAGLEKICFGALAWNEQALADELTNDTAHFLVLEKSGEAIGYIGTFVVVDSCYVSNIGILPQYRRQGFASVLMESACKEAFSLGARSISLEVRPSNTAAISLYKKLGFEEIGLRRGFYREPKEDALILNLDLTAEKYGQSEINKNT